MGGELLPGIKSVLGNWPDGLSAWNCVVGIFG